MRVSEALEVPPLDAGCLVAGDSGLQRRVSWVHVVDLPQPGPWIGRDQILLSTGYAWPGTDSELINLIRELDSRGVAAICLAVPSYHAHFPDVAKSEANRVGLPLIEVPWEIPFAKISERVNRAIVAEQQRYREHADALHRSLTRSSIEAESLDDIIREFARLIHRPVVLEDVDGLVLASSLPDRSRAPAMFRSVSPASTGTSGVLQTLVEKGYWANIHSSQSASRITLGRSGQTSTIIICPIWLKHELEGIICIWGDDRPLGEFEIQAVEHAATVIALHIARDRAVVNVEQRLRFSLIDTLLDGQFSGDALGLERAVLMGYQPALAHRVAVCILNEPLPLNRTGYLRRERFISRLARRMTSYGIPPLISPSMNEIAMVVPKDTDLNHLTAGLLDASISMCVGEVHSGADGVHLSYREARAVIPWARSGHIVWHRDTVLPRILDGDDGAKQQFIETMLSPIHQSLHADVYIETLRALADCGFNQARAAERLSIHHKTMQYRVGKLEDVLGMNLAEGDVRFRISLLIYLLEFEEQKRVKTTFTIPSK